MQSLSMLKYCQLRFLSKPVCDRAIYRAIRKFRVRSIVEIGLENGLRAANMIRVAQKFAGNRTVRYTGIDLFEERSTGSLLSLINVHKELNKLKAKTQLVPGEPHQT